MPWAAILVFAVQAAVIAVDEFHFHYKRGLPLFERIGHPLDTLTVLLVFCYLLFSSVSGSAIRMFALLAIFSMIFVTKDEYVHAKLCGWGEHWTHAWLFLVHPLAFLAGGALWWRGSGGSPFPLAGSVETCHRVLLAQTCLLTLWLAYQTVYWNFLWKPSSEKKTG